MKLYRKRPFRISATQWNQHGDHPDVKKGPMVVPQGSFNMNNMQAIELPPKQVPIPDTHGWMEGTQVVSPGDYILRGENGFMVVAGKLFDEQYEEAEVTDA